MVSKLDIKPKNTKELTPKVSTGTVKKPAGDSSATKISDDLSGTKVKFGSLSGDKSALTSSLTTKAGAAKTEETTATTTPDTETTTTPQETLVFSFNQQLDVKSKVGGLGAEIRNANASIFKTGATGTTSEVGDTVTLSSSSTQSGAASCLNSANSYISGAKNFAAQAEECEKNCDWEGSMAYYQKAKEALELAKAQIDEAQENGASTQDLLAANKEYSSLYKTYSQNYSSVSTMYTSSQIESQLNSSTSGSGSSTSWLDNLNNNAKSISGLFQNTNQLLGNLGGGSSTGGTASVGGGSSAGLGSKISSLGSSSPFSMDRVTNGVSAVASSFKSSNKLNYDKEYEQAVNQSGAPEKFNAAASKETEAQRTISTNEKTVSDCDVESGKLDSEINKVNGNTEKFLEEYKSAKEKESQATKEYQEQSKVAEEQGKLKADYDKKLGELKGQTSEKQEAKASAKTADDNATQELSAAKIDLTKKESAYNIAKANFAKATPETKEALQKALDTAEREYNNAKTRLVKAEENKKKTAKDLKDKTAELEKHLNEIKIYEQKQSEAAKKAGEAGKKAGELETTMAAAKQEAASKGQCLQSAEGQVKQLKDRIDALYQKKTVAETAIATAKAQQGAAATEKDLAQQLANNAVEAEKSKNSDGVIGNAINWFKDRV